MIVLCRKKRHGSGMVVTPLLSFSLLLQQLMLMLLLWLLMLSFPTIITIHNDDNNTVGVSVGVGGRLLVATAFTTTPSPSTIMSSPSLVSAPLSAASTTSTSIIPKEHKLYATYQKIQAWKNGNTKKKSRQEFQVQEEHLLFNDNDGSNGESESEGENNSNHRSLRITHFVATHECFPGSLISANAVNLACRAGTLLLNNEIVTGARRVQRGDVLTYVHDQVGDRRTNVPTHDLERCQRFCASRLRVVTTLSDQGASHTPLRVLYEDNWMAIVCKPAGIHSMSYSETFGNSLCLDELLPLLLTPPSSSSSNVTTADNDEPLLAPLPCHRLDRRVAGPVIVAKTRRALIGLTKSFEEKKVRKEYRALVVGRINNTTSNVNITTTTTVANNNNNKNGTTALTITSFIEGRESITEVVVLQETPCNINGILTDVQLFPHTGRRHQLRIHCAKELGTPILGDDLYHPHNSDPDQDAQQHDQGDGDTSTSTNTNTNTPVPIPVPAVRRRHGLYLYCKKVAIPHPIGRNDDENNNRVSVEIPEPYRMTRTREKALKGYEWTQQQNKQAKEEEEKEKAVAAAALANNTNNQE